MNNFDRHRLRVPLVQQLWLGLVGIGTVDRHFDLLA